MIVEHIQPVGHMVIKSLRRYRKVSECSRMERKRSTEHLLMHVWNIHLVIDVGLMGGEGPGIV